MIQKCEQKIRWLEFEQLAGLKHGVFLKGASLSSAQQALGAMRSASGAQPHGADVAYVDDEGVFPVDGCITQKEGLALVVRHADCQAVIFYDPCTRALANVHCGWRGNVLGILQKTVQQLKTCCGALPQNLRVCISPSLGPQRAEFDHYRADFPPAFHRHQIKPSFFDLWAVSRMQLMEAGVLDQHIEVAQICSYAHPDFHSYRQDKTSERNITAVVLSSSKV